MILFLPFLVGSAAAAAVVACVLLATRGRAWGAAIAVGLGYAAAHAVVFGLPPVPITDVTHWLFWIALAGSAAGLLERRPEIRLSRALAMRLGPAIALAWLISRPRIRFAWSAGEAAAWLAGIAAVTTLFSASASATTRRLSAFRLHAIAAAYTGAFAALLSATGSLLLGSLAASLATAHGTAAGIGWIRKEDRAPAGALFATGLLLPSLWLSGYLYADTPFYSALLLGFAPAGGWWAMSGRRKSTQEANPLPADLPSA